MHNHLFKHRYININLLLGINFTCKTRFSRKKEGQKLTNESKPTSDEYEINS